MNSYTEPHADARSLGLYDSDGSSLPGFRGYSIDSLVSEEFEIRACFGEGAGAQLFVYRIDNRELVAYSHTLSDREYYNDLAEFREDFGFREEAVGIPVLD